MNANERESLNAFFEALNDGPAKSQEGPRVDDRHYIVLLAGPVVRVSIETSGAEKSLPSLSSYSRSFAFIRG